jgi:hypothetical protein
MDKNNEYDSTERDIRRYVKNIDKRIIKKGDKIANAQAKPSKDFFGKVKKVLGMTKDVGEVIKKKYEVAKKLSDYKQKKQLKKTKPKKPE